jgi:hypothetical protein
MPIKALDTVVLLKDLPSHKLKRGDLGVVVEMYSADGIEVEFVTGSGQTQALVTLKTSDVRAAGSTDVLSVRPIDAARAG